MHASMEITDGVYGALSADDIHEVISNLAPDKKGKEVDKELLEKLADLAKILADNPEILQGKSTNK